MIVGVSPSKDTETFEPRAFSFASKAIFHFRTKLNHGSGVLEDAKGKMDGTSRGVWEELKLKVRDAGDAELLGFVVASSALH